MSSTPRNTNARNTNGPALPRPENAPTGDGLNRLSRRTTLLRGKRAGAFDRDQYYLERAERARVARKTRVQLRRMEPVVLVAPRWSQAREFLDEIAVDLLIGEPMVRARTLSLHPLEGRTPHQAWTWLVLAVQEFCVLPLEGPAWQVVSRRGFRHVMRELFARADEGGCRCLMIHGLQHIHVEALRDLIEVFLDHRRESTTPPRFNLLLAGSIDAPHFDFGGDRIFLPDFGDHEALEALVEQLGPDDAPRLRNVAQLLGGVPELLDRVARGAGHRLAEILADRGQLWTAMGVLSTEIRRAYDIVATNEALGERLEHLAREGPLAVEPATDELLARAGLVRMIGGTPRSRRTVLRAPLLAELAL